MWDKNKIEMFFGKKTSEIEKCFCNGNHLQDST